LAKDSFLSELGELSDIKESELLSKKDIVELLSLLKKSLLSTDSGISQLRYLAFSSENKKEQSFLKNQLNFNDKFICNILMEIPKFILKNYEKNLILNPQQERKFFSKRKSSFKVKRSKKNSW